MCPFVQEANEECFCSDMRSLYVEAAIHYCGGNYEDCVIYKRKVRTT